MDDFKRKLIAGYDLDLESWPVEDVSKMILEILQSSMSSSESDAFGRAAGFFNDLVVHPSQPSDIAIRFRKSYQAGEQRAIIGQLESALAHPLFLIRWNSISVLGRVGSVDSIEKMVESFDRAFERDPSILPRLVSEISWIIGCASEPKRFDGVYLNLLERLVHSDSYLNRWAAVEIIQHQPDPEPSHLVEQLKNDVHPLVRLQARNAEEASEKRVNFESVAVDFVSPNGYSVSDIDRFVSEWLAENAP